MTTERMACPVCEEGTLVPFSYSDSFVHEGRQISVNDLEASRCSACAAEPIAPDQIRRNQLRISDAKRRAHGLLTSQRIRETREVLGLSQQDAALIFGGGTNAFSKYERGQTVQSVSMDRLLRTAATFPWLLDFWRLLAGQEPPAVQNGSYIDAQDVSLNDPCYTSKPVAGQPVLASPTVEESNIVPLWTKQRPRKVA